MPISMFFCVKWLICLNATNKLAVLMDQDVHDYFDIHDKN